MSTTRTSLLVLLCSAATVSTLLAAGTIHGTAVDPSGHPVPRAHIRVLDPTGRELASTFADEGGHFEATAAPDCRVEASLPGFETVTAPCSTTGNVRLELAVAPIAEHVLVSATSTPAPTEQIGAATSVFTAQDLAERREPLVADLLRTTPGAMVVSTGAPGGVTSLFVRGGESSYNKVLIDGIPINEPGGTFNLGNVTTDDLERVEVVRGAHSALFGSDAMASVVQLFTKRADRLDPHPHGAASIETGTFGTYNAAASTSGARGRLDYALGADRLSTSNDGPNHVFENTALTLNAGVDLGHCAAIRVVGRGELQHSGVPGPTAIQPADRDAFFDRNDGIGGAAFDQTLSSSFHQHAVYSFSVSHQQSTDLAADSPSDFTYDSTNTLRRHYASYQADLRMPHAGGADHLLTVLADWNGERMHLVDRMALDPGDADARHSRNNFGVALQEQALWSRVFVTVGGRFEHNDSFGTAAVPQASAVFVVHPGSGSIGDTRLRASGGLGIKEPTELQSFSTNPFFRGNPDLDPERSNSYEIGVDQRLARDRARLQATWFDNRFSNQITLVNSVYTNINKTRGRGGEFAAEFAPMSQVRLTGGYTFLDSSIVANTSAASIGTVLLRRPRHSGYAGVVISEGTLALTVNGYVIGAFADSDFTTARTQNPGFNVWNARASYTITRQLTILASMDNVADESYEEPLGYSGLGRAVRIGARVGF